MADDPVVELIRQKIAEVVEGVTQLDAVEAVARHGNSSANMTAVVEQGDETLLGLNDSNAAVGRDTYEQEIMVFVTVGNPRDDEDYDQLCNRIVGLIRKAVMADVTLGGLALLTHEKPAKLFANDSGVVSGPVVPFLVRYRTALDDPFTAA